MRLGLSMRQPNGRTLIQRAISSLRARGTDAHLWLPGGDVRTYGPELVVNGDFSNGATGWSGWSTGSISVTGGVATVTSGGVYTGASTSFNTRAGATYRAIVVMSSGTGSPAFTTPAGGWQLSSPVTFVASGATSSIYLVAQGAASTALFTSVSVREITSITPTIQNGLTTGNYLESSGNTLATVDNPTGLVLDALGTVGVDVVNNTMEIGGAWTNVAGVYAGNGESASSLQNSSLTVGRFYKATFTVANYVSGTVQPYIGLGTPLTTFSANGTYTVYGLCALNFNFYLKPTSFNGSVSNISVREVSGIHATQATTANKPVLRRGLVNLALQSQSFASPWAAHPNYSGASGVITNSGNSTTPQGLFQQLTGGGNGVYTIAVEASQGTCSSLLIAVEDNATDTVRASQVFALTGTETIYCVTGTTAGGAPGVRAKVGTNGVTGTINAKVGVFQGSYTASDIIKNGGIPTTTSAAASNPDSGRYSWSFDGSNDSLALGSVPFQQSDDWCVSIAATLTSAGSTRSLYSHSNASNHQVAWLKYADSGTVDWVTWDGSSTVIATSPLTYVGTPIVIRMMKVGTSGTLWINGVQVATADFTLVTSPALTTASIGSFGGIAMYHSGALTAPVVVKGTVTAAEALLIDRFVASTAGITL